MTQPLPQDGSILPADRAAAAQKLAAGLEPAQLAWLSGYFAGLAAGASPSGSAARPPAAAAEAAPTLTILSASHTGNGRKIAERLFAATRAQGIAARLVKAGDYSPRELARETLLYAVVSTHGEGDPPEEARALFEFLAGKRAPQLPQLQYAVLALGDSSYAQYCAAGRSLDERLAKLGARRLLPRVDCDVDYERLARPWLDDALARVSEHANRQATAAVAAAPVLSIVNAVEHTRANPAAAEVITNQRITGRDALKDVRHVELVLADEAIRYEPGDALGVVHRNPEHAIDALLQVTRLDGGETVSHAGRQLPLHAWLRDELEITRIARPLLVTLAERGNVSAQAWLAPDGASAFQDFTQRSQVADLFARFPVDWSGASLVAALRPITSRVYSIASSQAVVGPEVHTTVAVVGSDGASAPGAASAFLAAQAVDTPLQVWIERNERFRVPPDSSRDIIMIGPGTGVAPFRAFLQERESTGAKGRNWLFFGGRTRRDEFLYQLEWQAALKRGSLQRLDVAFSRDQAHKIYVQDRLREAGREIFDWLSNGAYLYVCGDAARMAPDVQRALLDIAAQHGALAEDDAREWLGELTADGRYLRDVY
jgi:sulfite reductase (NADPH) flavoprotein alpha-component